MVDARSDSVCPTAGVLLWHDGLGAGRLTHKIIVVWVRHPVAAHRTLSTHTDLWIMGSSGRLTDGVCTGEWCSANRDTHHLIMVSGEWFPVVFVGPSVLSTWTLTSGSCGVVEGSRMGLWGTAVLSAWTLTSGSCGVVEGSRMGLWGTAVLSAWTLTSGSWLCGGGPWGLC